MGWGRQNRPRADQVDLVLNALTIMKSLRGIDGPTSQLAQLGEHETLKRY